MEKLNFLSCHELKQINGGDIAALGAKAKEAWNSAREWWCSLDLTSYADSPIHGPNTNHYM